MDAVERNTFSNHYKKGSISTPILFLLVRRLAGVRPVHALEREGRCKRAKPDPAKDLVARFHKFASILTNMWLKRQRAARTSTGRERHL